MNDSINPVHREVDMAQAAMPERDNIQDDMTLPMLDPEAKHSSSDAGVSSPSKGHQRCPPPDVIEAAASGNRSASLPEVGRCHWEAWLACAVERIFYVMQDCL
jgi:hypothetical protein